MLNTTLLSLNIMSMASMSPFYTIGPSHGWNQYCFLKSQFTNFFSNAIKLYDTNYKMIIMHNAFKHFLNTPLVFESSPINNNDADCGIGNYKYEESVISNQNYEKPSDESIYHAYFMKGCNDVEISYSSFTNCKGDNAPGGSIYVTQNCIFVLHTVLFSGSSTSHCRGGAISITNGSPNSNSGDYPDDTPIKQFNAQYCCFYKCYPVNYYNMFGVAIYSSANDTILYFTSAVDCPEKAKATARGAQFDIKSENVKSKNVNITGGKSQFCAGIEYRKAKSGFFKFHTITHISECMFATSYTSIDISQVEISHTNFAYNVLKKNTSAANDLDQIDSALVHITQKDIILHYFYFTHCIFEYEFSKLVSRAKDSQGVVITLDKCFIDESVDESRYDNEIQRPNDGLVIIKNLQTPEMNHLKYSEKCQGNIATTGKVTLEPVSETPSPTFTQSDEFSFSADFTFSGQFSPSFGFTFSSYFSGSKPFSLTSGFTKTTAFTVSSKFSQSNDFTASKPFTQSLNFDHTSFFTPSNTFTLSDYFTESNDFSESFKFTKSGLFSLSSYFTDSDNFSSSSPFSTSAYFSKSALFSNSEPFSNSELFSNSALFSDSYAFTQSNEIFAPTEQIVDIIIKDQNSNESNKAFGAAQIAGIAIAAAAVVAAVLAGIFIINKKRKLNDFSEPSVKQETVEEDVHYDNPLYGKGVDDPFQQDFDEVENVEEYVL